MFAKLQWGVLLCTSVLLGTVGCGEVEVSDASMETRPVEISESSKDNTMEESYIEFAVGGMFNPTEYLRVDKHSNTVYVVEAVTGNYALWEEYMDGIQWRLRFYIAGDMKEYQGSNDYPPNWDEFRQYVKSFDGGPPLEEEITLYKEMNPEALPVGVEVLHHSTPKGGV